MGKLSHVAVYTWKPGTTDAQKAALSEALATLPRLLPDIRRYRFGPDAGLGSGTDEFALVAEFDDVDGYRRYASDPRHLEIIERFLKPILQSRHAVQMEEG